MSVLPSLFAKSAKCSSEVAKKHGEEICLHSGQTESLEKGTGSLTEKEASSPQIVRPLLAVGELE